MDWSFFYFSILTYSQFASIESTAWPELGIPLSLLVVLLIHGDHSRTPNAFKVCCYLVIIEFVVHFEKNNCKVKEAILSRMYT